MPAKVADLFAALSLRVDRRSFQQGRNELGQFVSTGNKGIKGMSGKLKSLTASVASVFGGFAVKRAVGDAFNFESALDDLDVAAKGAAGTVDEMRDKMLRVSDATGVTKEQVLQGTAAFVEITGKGDEANRAMETFAKTAVATRADMGDIAQVAGRLSTNMGVSADQFEHAFSILVAGGKEGSVEFRNLAAELGGLAPQIAAFAGGKGVEGVAQLGAALQIGAQGFNTASEAATGLQGMMVALQRRTKEFEKAGVKVYGKDGQLRNLQEIVADLDAKNFSKTKLTELFGRIEGRKFFDALTRVDGAWQDMIDSTITATDVASDFAEKQQRDTQKVRRFWNKLKNEVTRTLSDVIDWLGSAVDKLEEFGVGTEQILVGVKVLAAFVAANALRMAASWAIAFGPLTIAMAAITAVTLAIQDLFSSADGREGFMADLLGADTAAALKMMLEDARDALVDLWDKAKEFKAWVTNSEVEIDPRARNVAALQQARASGQTVSDEAMAAALGPGGEQALMRRRLREMGVDPKTVSALGDMASFDFDRAMNRMVDEAYRRAAERYSDGGPGLSFAKSSRQANLDINLTMKDGLGNLARAIKQAVEPVVRQYVEQEVRKL